jgi:non-ribosomal peptide synthetase-like protein
MEILLADIWVKNLPASKISVNDNFFEIGGDSLLAGKVASELRRQGFDSIGIKDVYASPTLGKLASALETMPRAEPASQCDGQQQGGQNIFEKDSTGYTHRAPPSGLRMFTVGCVQLVVFTFLTFLASPVVFLAVGMYSWIIDSLINDYRIESLALIYASAVCGGALVSITVTIFVLLPLVKWTVIGRFKEGTYPLWGAYYVRWWMVRTLASAVPFALLQGTVFLNMYLRVMGAKIGRGVFYCGSPAMEYDLLDIGEDSWIGNETLLGTSEVKDGTLILRRVTIGKDTSVGARCCISGGSRVGSNVTISNMTLIRSDTYIPSNEKHGGSPAIFAGLNNTKTRPSVRPTILKESIIAACYALYFTFLATILTILTVLSSVGVLLLISIAEDIDVTLVIVVILFVPIVVTALWMIVLHLILIALRWIVLPWRVQPGEYPCTGLMFHRKMFFDILMRISLSFSHPMYASLFTQYFLKGLGCKIGNRVECSNLFGFTPGLTNLGSEIFIADFVGLNPPRICKGVMHLEEITIEDRSFVGNGSVISPGIEVADNSLIGLLSCPAECVPRGVTHIGSPSFPIPRRVTHTDPALEEQTYRPTWRLVARRMIWELFRSIAPATCLMYNFVGLYLLYDVAFSAATITDVASVLIPFVWLNVIISLCFVIAAKWIIVQRHRAEQFPLWSPGVWHAEFVTDMITTLGGYSFLQSARGTPFLPIIFRLLGATIGRNCYLDTIFITEPDLVTIGDDCCIGDRVTIQTHLFEDRVMRMDSLVIKEGCNIGALSVVLYNTHMGSGVTVAPLSLVMKGESYEMGTSWEGIPAQRHTQSESVVPLILWLKNALDGSPRVSRTPSTSSEGGHAADVDETDRALTSRLRVN